MSGSDLRSSCFHTCRETNSHQKPEHETQIRPLIGLDPESAQTAWDHAAAKAAGRKLTQRLVKAAVQELHAPAEPATPKPPSRRTLRERRRLIESVFGELFLLVRQNAGREALLPKLEALHGEIQGLFPTK